MLSLKVLFNQGSGEFLTEELREQVKDERLWSKKMLKLYRTMRKLEQRKYNSGSFAREFRQLTSYFALKYNLWAPSNVDGGTGENISNFSQGSKSSSFRASPPHNFNRSILNTSISPDRLTA